DRAGGNRLPGRVDCRGRDRGPHEPVVAGREISSAGGRLAQPPGGAGVFAGGGTVSIQRAQVSLPREMPVAVVSGAFVLAWTSAALAGISPWLGKRGILCRVLLGTDVADAALERWTPHVDARARSRDGVGKKRSLGSPAQRAGRHLADRGRRRALRGGR